MITQDNWTFTHFTNQKLKALVTYGASFEGSEVSEEFFATVIDDEGHDVFQQSFNNLNDACDYLNRRYQKIWKLVDATLKSSGTSGCDTCVAH